MAWLRYLSHPEVVMDPEVPVPRWGLRDDGRARVERFVADPPGWFDGLTTIVSSTETKATQAAGVLATAAGLETVFVPTAGEVDRSATGFVPSERHDALRDHLFDHPEVSADGWERAVDAQARIVGAIAPWWPPADPTDHVGILVVGHGAVGTFLWCHLTGHPIHLDHDQTSLGNLWCVDLADPGNDHAWRRY